MSEYRISKKAAYRIIDSLNNRSRRSKSWRVDERVFKPQVKSWGQRVKRCCIHLNYCYYKKNQKREYKASPWSRVLDLSSKNLSMKVDIYLIWFSIEYQLLKKMNSGQLHIKKRSDDLWFYVQSKSATRLKIFMNKDLKVNDVSEEISWEKVFIRERMKLWWFVKKVEPKNQGSWDMVIQALVKKMNRVNSWRYTISIIANNINILVNRDASESD